jgi:hypothetical protein
MAVLPFNCNLLCWAKAGLALCFCVLPLLATAQKAYIEKNGVVAVEAEHFTSQTKDGLRRWQLVRQEANGTSPAETNRLATETAGNGAFLHLLPDTRITHDDRLIPGENFSNVPGQMAILSYEVYFNTPGKYYVWVRAFSTGSEDNGLHVGLNGEWPESGQRMQWCEGKNAWTWASKQRTQANHCGEPQKIFLDIPTKGLHTISFSMREDGFRFDKWVMSQAYETPVGVGQKENKTARASRK